MIIYILLCIICWTCVFICGFVLLQGGEVTSAIHQAAGCQLTTEYTLEGIIN